MNIKLCSIDGNIGSGKTTLLKTINNTNVFIIDEPIKEWEELLGKITIDASKYCYLLQLKVAEHYANVKKTIDFIMKNNKSNIKCIVVERSINSTLDIFASIYKDQGILDEKKFMELRTLVENHAINFHYRILLQTSVKECLKRIKQRGRKCEEKISEKYLQDIEFYQKKMYLKFSCDKIKIINGNTTKKQILKTFNYILKDIL